MELSQSKYKLAHRFLEEDISNEKIHLIQKNIYDTRVGRDFTDKFDIIVLKDVIEHIPDQAKLLVKLQSFLNTGGYIFLGFPPWQMPFGGHQQICHNKFLAILPYYHLLPDFLYRGMLKFFGEANHTIKNLFERKSTGISIERFEEIVKKANYKVARRTLYLINPIYEYKFNLKPRKQFKLVASLPFIRNFFTTRGYYLIQPNNQ